jgi:hypothetical protein
MKKSKESMKTIQINNKHYIECDVVMLPTDKATKIFLSKEKDAISTMPVDTVSIGYGQHLYITSDEEIKEGETGYVHFNKIWGEIQPDGGKIVKVIGLYQKSPNHSREYIIEGNSTVNISDCSGKIIAATDSKLHLKCSCGEFDYMNCQQQMCEMTSLLQIPSIFIENYIEYNKGNVISKVFVEVKQLPFSTPNKKQFEFGVFADENNEISITLHEVEPKYISLERAKKYAKHQHYLGTQSKELVEFEDWALDSPVEPKVYSKEEVVKLIKTYHAEFAVYPTMNLDLRDIWITQNL